MTKKLFWTIYCNASQSDSTLLHKNIKSGEQKWMGSILIKKYKKYVRNSRGSTTKKRSLSETKGSGFIRQWSLNRSCPRWQFNRRCFFFFLLVQAALLSRAQRDSGYPPFGRNISWARALTFIANMTFIIRYAYFRPSSTPRTTTVTRRRARGKSKNFH